MTERSATLRSAIPICLAVLATARADTRLTADQAKDHIGEVATVCGTVVSPKYAVSSHRSPTFLNLDRPYPQQVFTILIWGDDRPKFGTPEVTQANALASREKSKSIAVNPRLLRPSLVNCVASEHGRRSEDYGFQERKSQGSSYSPVAASISGDHVVTCLSSDPSP